MVCVDGDVYIVAHYFCRFTRGLVRVEGMHILLLITFVGLPEDLFVLMEMYILLLITFVGLPEDLFVLMGMHILLLITFAS